MKDTRSSMEKFYSKIPVIGFILHRRKRLKEEKKHLVTDFAQSKFKGALDPKLRDLYSNMILNTWGDMGKYEGFIGTKEPSKKATRWDKLKIKLKKLTRLRIKIVDKDYDSYGYTDED